MAQTGQALATAGQAKEDAAMAQHRAESARGLREADVLQRSVDEQMDVDAVMRAARAKAEAQADADSAEWLQQLDMQSRKEPNPSRWWENQSSLGKALWAISALAGSYTAAYTPGGKNIAMGLIQDALKADMEEQRQRLQRELTSLRARGDVIKQRNLRTMSDLHDDHTMALTRIQALERAWMARAVAPGDLEGKAVKAAMKSEFEAMKAPYIEKYRAQRAAEEQNKLDRAHQWGMQKARIKAQKEAADLAWERAKEMADIQFENQLALSPVALGGAAGGGSARNPVDPKTGETRFYEMSSRPDAEGKNHLVLADASGKQRGDGVVLFPKDTLGAADFKAANQSVASADIMYNNLVKLRDDIKGRGRMFTNAVAGETNPELNSLIQETAYAVAQLQNDRVTDKDFSSAVQQIMGFDPNGGWLQRGKLLADPDGVVRNLTRLIDSHHKKIELGLQQFYHPEVNGGQGRILYTPSNLQPEEGPPLETSADVRGDRPTASATAPENDPGRIPPVASLQEYHRRRAVAKSDPEGASQPKNALPPHDATVIDSLSNTAESNSPDTIRKKAATILDSLKREKEQIEERVGGAITASKDPWSGSYGQIDQAQMEQDGARLQKIVETETMVRDMSAKAVKDAEKKLLRFAEGVRLYRSWPAFPNSDSDLIKRSKEIGLDGARKEVEEILKRFPAK